MQTTYLFGDRQCTVTMCAAEDLYADTLPAAFGIADTNTARYLPPVPHRCVLPAGEEAKSFDELGRVLSRMLEADLTRDGLVIGTGGGVVCDLSALAASLYMRGTRLMLVPTTLLAMVDASLGGKTGVNFGGYKNLVGTFYPASDVRVSIELLRTLPEREYRSGLAELIKTAFLGDERMVAVLETSREQVLKRDETLIADLVWRCIEIKLRIVEADPTESGPRASLNLGHTFAHALESVSGIGVWSHGEAVAWGMARAAELGAAAGVTDRADAARVTDLLRSYGYRLDPVPQAAAALREAMGRDKKRRANRIRFVLLPRMAETVVREVDERLVRDVLDGRLYERG